MFSREDYEYMVDFLSRNGRSRDRIDNDIAMLSFAGIGVAMGNSCDQVKARADFVTRAVDEDGIAYAMEKLGLIAVYRLN